METSKTGAAYKKRRERRRLKIYRQCRLVSACRPKHKKWNTNTELVGAGNEDCKAKCRLERFQLPVAAKRDTIRTTWLIEFVTSSINNPFGREQFARSPIRLRRQHKLRVHSWKQTPPFRLCTKCKQSQPRELEGLSLTRRSQMMINDKTRDCGQTITHGPV